jgi:RNA polymerase sigma factor (TIGR02999 family)
MSLSSDSKASAVLQAAQAGDGQAAADLLPLVYAELYQLARARLARQPPGQTLTPTALVHEAYLRIADHNTVTWEGRQHFFFAAARAMRDILVEQARRKAAARHGGGGAARSWTRPAPSWSRHRTTCSRYTRRWRNSKSVTRSRRRLCCCVISRG